jgi:hypothetical protein
MILQFYGYDIPERRLMGLLGTRERGTNTGAIKSFLRDNDFDVTDKQNATIEEIKK